MPSWKVHIIFNLIFMILFTVFLNQIGFIDNFLVSLSVILFSSIASVIPDIDCNKSKVRDKFSLLIAGVIIIYLLISLSIESVLFGIIGFVSIYLILRFFPTKHRGVTHRIEFGIIFSLIFAILMLLVFETGLIEMVIFFTTIFFGYFSHIFLDKIA